MIGFIGYGPWRDPFLNISITNHNRIRHHPRDDRNRRSDEAQKIRGLINSFLNISVSIEDADGPFTNLPKKIDVGGEFSLRFWSGENAFIESEVDRVGVIDTFGRSDE